jgi:hypothetical protein
MSTLESIVDAWFLKAIEVYPETARGGMMKTGDRFRNPVSATLRASLTILASELAGEMDIGAVESALDAILRVRAVQDCTPAQALGFTAQVRGVIDERQAETEFPYLDQRLAVLTSAAERQYAHCKQDLARVRSREASRLRELQPRMRQTL